MMDYVDETNYLSIEKITQDDKALIKFIKEYFTAFYNNLYDLLYAIIR